MGIQTRMTLRRRALFALPALGLAKGNDQPVFLGGCNFSREQFEATGGKQSDLEKFDAAAVRVIVTAVGSGSYFQTGEKRFELAGDDEWILGVQRKNVNDAVAAIHAGRDPAHLRQQSHVPCRDGRRVRSPGCARLASRAAVSQPLVLGEGRHAWPGAHGFRTGSDRAYE